MAKLGLTIGLAGLLAGAAPADAPLLLQAEAQVLTGACSGGDLRIEGNHNTIMVAGECRSLLLKGIGNIVRLGMTPGASIRLEGSGNRVRFTARGAGPAVKMLGVDNEVAAGPQPTTARPAAARPAAPPIATASTGALTLAGNDQQRVADCAGRDVAVTGARSAYELRGGCRALTVQGDLLTIRAEMQPGARIAVTGLGSVVSWRLRDRGRDPLVVAQGAGSRVQRALPSD